MKKARQNSAGARPIKEDIYTRITNKIIEDLEKGVRPWIKPWSAEHAAGSITKPLRHNGQSYNGINVIMLWSEAFAQGYSAPIWMTFRQAKELGGNVKKGDHGSLVIYADTYTKTDIDKKTGMEIEEDIPFLKGYTVFNVEQIENLPEHYYAVADEPQTDPAERIEHVDLFLSNMNAEIRHGGNNAYYATEKDYIRLPHFEFFKDPESYYATRLHETVHWTRHPDRLDRSFGRKKYGDEGYAIEELVAELGSAFMAADLGIEPEVREDHSAYIENWLKVLKKDKRAIFKAASHAQKAADFLHSKQPKQETSPDMAAEHEITPQHKGSSYAA